MQVSQKDWMRYVERLSAINQKAADEMQMYIDRYGVNDMESLVSYAYALTTKYGEASSALACQMYDAMAELEGVSVAFAEPASIASINAVSRNIQDAAKKSINYISQEVGRTVKQAGQDTILKNAKRDGAFFAWIPVGDTCPYCLMIASNGWRRIDSKSKRATADHIHANCNCSYQVKFKAETDVEGYHPKSILKTFESMPEKKWADRINAMRRMKYAEEKEESTED